MNNHTSNNDSDIALWSIPELVYYFDVSREDLEKTIEQSKKETYAVFEYDLDKIYNNRNELTVKINEVKSVYDIFLIDESIRKS